MRPAWMRCENCTGWERRGDTGECHSGIPGVPNATFSGRWPPVGPDEYCDKGFVFNPEPLFAELERLNYRATKAENERDELMRFKELCDAMDEDNGRVPLPTITNEE